MSCWKQKRTLRHSAWKWGSPLVRPCEEQTPGLAVCTAYSPYCHPPYLPLPEENLELYLLREQQTAQGQTKRRKLQLCRMLHANCFMETLVSPL